METEVLSAETSAALAKISIVAIDRTKLVKFGEDWKETLAQLKETVTELASPQAEQWAADRLTEVRTALKDQEVERELMVRPLIDDKRTIDTGYRESRAPAEAVEAYLRGLLAAATEARHKAELAARALVAATAAAGDDEACGEALAALPEAVKLAGASTQMVWDFEVVDVSLVPPSHMCPDIVLLNDLCTSATRRNASPEPVPGVRFFQKAHVRATSRGKKK